MSVYNVCLMMKANNVTLLGLLALGLSGAALALEPVPEGRVRFYNVADSDFDVYSKNPDEKTQAWMRKRYARMQTYSPYFDRRLAWYPNAWVYKDSYAIKSHWSEFRRHPEWVLRDAKGNLLYIPWGCENRSCPQHAADFGNPEFRKHWIDQARALIDKGYRGLWIDDVNLTWRVSDGDGRHVRPIDPRTDRPMTLDDWRRYFAEFMEEIRIAMPDIEIAHNAIWYAGPLNDPFIARQIAAADVINLERGATDRGLRAGRGRWGLETFLAYADQVHAMGRSVIFMDYGQSSREREYGMAAWLLVSNGTDMISSNRLGWSSPGGWWIGYQLDLGRATSERYTWRDVLRRDFECGLVLLNQPRRPSIYLHFAESFDRIDGRSVNAITLRDASAAVLLRPCAQSEN